MYEQDGEFYLIEDPAEVVGLEVDEPEIEHVELSWMDTVHQRRS